MNDHLNIYISEKNVRCPFCGHRDEPDFYMHECYQGKIHHGQQCTKCKELYKVEETVIIQYVSPAIEFN